MIRTHDYEAECIALRAEVERLKAKPRTRINWRQPYVWAVLAQLFAGTTNAAVCVVSFTRHQPFSAVCEGLGALCFFYLALLNFRGLLREAGGS